MKPTTRHMMQSLKQTARNVARWGVTRAERAAHLRTCRAIRDGRAHLRDTHLCDFRAK